MLCLRKGSTQDAQCINREVGGYVLELQTTLAEHYTLQNSRQPLTILITNLNFLV